MATNLIYNGNDELNRSRVVPVGTKSGDPVVQGGVRPGVAITSRGDATATKAIDANGWSVTYPNGGFNNASDEATIAFDGTYEFAVTGGLVTTPNETAVYAVVSDGVVTSLTLTAGSNVLFGHVDYPNDYYKRAGILPVRIGAAL